MQDRFRADVREMVEGDPFDGLQAIADHMYRAMSATGLGEVRRHAAHASGDRGDLQRESLTELRAAIEDHDMHYNYLLTSLTMPEGREFVAQYDVRIWHRTYTRPPTLGVEIQGSTKVIVDGLERAAEAGLKRWQAKVAREQAAAEPSEPPAITGGASMSADAAPLAPGRSSGPTQAAPTMGSRLADHAIQIMGGALVALLVGYLLFRFGWN